MDSLSVFEGEDQHTPLAGISINRDGDEELPRMQVGGRVLYPAGEWDPGEWHRYTVQLMPGGEVEVWVDEVFVVETNRVLFGEGPVRVVLEGRSVAGAVVIDDVAVYEGFLLGR